MPARTRYRFGSFELDPLAHELSREGERVRIQDHPLRILEALVLRPGELVTREELIAALWPPGTFVDSEHGLNTAVRKLRQTLGPAHSRPAPLETVPRRGYRLTLPVETLETHERASLAVLPLEDLSPARDQTHLCEGLAEELVRALAPVPGLRIAQRGATYRSRDEEPARAGLQLGVRHVLAGSLRSDGERLRIDCRLLESATGRELWSGRFDRRLTDLLLLEEEIAGEVVRSVLERLLSGGADVTTAGPRTASADAYDLFLRAKAAWRLRGHSILRAISLLERALLRDPQYVPALQFLAACCYSAGAGGHLPASEAVLRLAGAARRAFALAPEDAASWVVEGMRREWAERRLRAAAEAYREGIARAPRETLGYGWLALLLASQGRFDDAIATARRGHAIDPGEPPTATYLGWSYFFARRFDDAFAVFEPSPEFAIAWIVRAWIHESRGRWDDALAALDEAVASNETRWARRERIRLLAAMGREAEALDAYEAIVESGALFPAFERGLLALARGDRRLASDELAIAHAERSPWMRFVRVDPRLDGLRSELTRKLSRRSSPT